MSELQNNRRFLIPLSRRLSWDLLHFNRHVPLCAHDRVMKLAAAAEARAESAVRIAWPTMFLKAYGCVARQIPQLRQTWYRFPCAHLYQHPRSIGVVTVHREIDGHPWLFWGNVGCPEEQTLQQIQTKLDIFRDGPVQQVFRRQLQLAGTPTALRRMIWWWNLNLATENRARRLGTFFLSTLAGRGAEIQLPPSVHTGCLTFGPLDASHCCRVTLAYDHRIMDGALVAEVLQRLERFLNHEIAIELRGIGPAAVMDHRIAAA